MRGLKIEGGRPLQGKVTPVANKNALMPLIPSVVLADEPVTFHNVPRSSSVRVMLRIYRSLGGKVAYLKGNRIKMDSSGIKNHVVDEALSKLERASLMYLGPLLARLGKADLCESGGCKLGNRPVDTLLQGLYDLGAKSKPGNIYSLSTKGLVGNDDIWLQEASVTGTENLIIASVKAKGKTVIYNAACEPHVQDLCRFLVSIGAKIKGIGTNRLEIDGVKRLGGGEWTVISDHIDVAGLIVAAALTDGDVTIKNAIPEHMTQILRYLGKIGLKVQISGDSIHVPSGQQLICKPNIKGDLDKINDQPWPGYPVDLIPQAVVLAAKAGGTIRIYSVMYEAQLMFVEELAKLGGRVILSGLQSAVTMGPSRFKGAKISYTSILQCAHALLLAALGAEGTTLLYDGNQISRRYPDLVEKLNALGAQVERI